jgi:hypothetical protein
MSLELVSAIAAIGTFVVIAATAFAAIVQLHHLRGGNQIVALTEIREVVESEKFVAARRFLVDELPGLMKEPGVKEGLQGVLIDARLEQASYVGNIFEGLGTLVKYRIIDRDIACDLWGGVVLIAWKQLLPITTLRRQRPGPWGALWENFEYLAVMSEDFYQRHPQGAYPDGVRRMPPSPTG